MNASPSSLRRMEGDVLRVVLQVVKDPKVALVSRGWRDTLRGDPEALRAASREPRSCVGQ